MFEYTHKNHFKFGYDRNWFTERQSPDQKWTVEYGTCSEPVGGFFKECIKAAKLIRQSTDLPIKVLFSGGIDSEVALKSFYYADIPVTAVIARFTEEHNNHDIPYAVEVCEDLKIPYEMPEIDLKHFFENELLEFAEKSQCVSPQLCVTMKVASLIDGLPVLGSGECYLTKGDDEKWRLFEREKVASWYRYFINEDRPAVPGFFQYTPEQMLAWLEQPMMLALASNGQPDIVNSAQRKHELHGKRFQVKRRPKYTGFEQVMDLDKHYRAQLKERYPHHDAIFYSEYFELLEDLHGLS